MGIKIIAVERINFLNATVAQGYADKVIATKRRCHEGQQIVPKIFYSNDLIGNDEHEYPV